MPKITFDADGKTVEAALDDWFYDVCVEAKASVPFSCKAGACGTCATEVKAGMDALGKPTQRELRTLEAEKLDPAHFRLPCLHGVRGDLTLGRSVHAAQGSAPLAVGRATVEAFRRLNLTVAEVRFFVETAPFAFRPGQYVIFPIPSADGREVIRRSYSISTPPSESRHFEICVRAVAGGHGSNWAHRLRPGQQVSFEGPLGDFTLQDSPHDILMVATGTGISPIKSMLLHLLDTHSARKVRLFFGLRSTHDLFYTDLFRGLEAHDPHFSYEIVLSAPDPALWAGPRGRVTTLVAERVTAEAATHTEAYLCGGRSMVEEVATLLRAKGLPEERIHFENFY